VRSRVTRRISRSFFASGEGVSPSASSRASTKRSVAFLGQAGCFTSGSCTAPGGMNAQWFFHLLIISKTASPREPWAQPSLDRPAPVGSPSRGERFLRSDHNKPDGNLSPQNPTIGMGRMRVNDAMPVLFRSQDRPFTKPWLREWEARLS